LARIDISFFPENDYKNRPTTFIFIYTMATTPTITPTTLALSEQDQRLVQTLAIGLAENLLHHYPDTDETPEAVQVQCWLNEILERIQQQHGSTGDYVSAADTVNDRNLAQLVMKEGIQRWKSNQSIFASAEKVAGSKTSKSMTFSFLDQWNAAGTGGGLSLLDSIITWDRIQQETSLDSKLKLLLKVQHMDDIHPDWDKVCPLLLQGLQQQSTATDNSDVVGCDDPSSTGDFIKLHETLFEQSRSSPEYTTAQIQLCQNIVTLLQATLAASTNTTHLLRRLIRAFWNMWMDWMVSRGGGPNSNVNLVESIGRDVWSCYNSRFGVMQSMMFKQDPYARWFTSWVAHLPPSKVVSLVDSAPELVSYMVLECGSVSTTCRYNGNDNHDALCRHYLALLAGILRQTRVSLFPWHRIHLKGGTSASVSRFFDLFHGTIERELRLRTIPSTRAPDLKRIRVCADAIETLLWGCSETDPVTLIAMLDVLDDMPYLATDVMYSIDGGAQVCELLNGVQRRVRNRNVKL
jgi:hypothetical protein